MSTLIVRSLVSCLAACVVVASAADAKTDLGFPFREVRVDVPSLTPDAKVYHRGDVVLRVLVRGVSTVRTAAARSVDLNGFPVTIPKDLALREFTIIRSLDARMFSKRDGVGTPFKGTVFCNVDRFNLGPFTSGKTEPFKGVACFVDENHDGVFEAVTFVGQFSSREVGPVPINPMPYEMQSGGFSPDEHIDLVFDKLHRGSAFLSPVLYDVNGRHKTIRMYTNERVGPVTQYSYGCAMKAPGDPAAPAHMLDATIAISDPDPTPEAQSFRAVVRASNHDIILAQIEPWQTIFDWLPNLATPCGDDRGK